MRVSLGTTVLLLRGSNLRNNLSTCWGNIELLEWMWTISYFVRKGYVILKKLSLSPTRYVILMLYLEMGCKKVDVRWTGIGRDFRENDLGSKHPLKRVCYSLAALTYNFLVTWWTSGARIPKSPY